MAKPVANGGFAFPFEEVTTRLGGMATEWQNHGGMTVRDYFAAHANIPWNAVIETLILKGIKKPTVQQVLAYTANIKYELADVMLDERSGNAATDRVKGDRAVPAVSPSPKEPLVEVAKAGEAPAKPEDGELNWGDERVIWLPPKTPSGFVDLNGDEIMFGDIIKKRVTVNHNVHGDFSYHEVKAKLGHNRGIVPFLSYLCSDKEAVVPRGYMTSELANSYKAADIDGATAENSLALPDPKNQLEIFRGRLPFEPI